MPPLYESSLLNNFLLFLFVQCHGNIEESGKKHRDAFEKVYC